MQSGFCLAVIVKTQLKAAEPVRQPPGLEKEGSVCQSVRFLCCSLLWCKNACMPATSAIVTHRLERCHFKPGYPDIASVLRHLHLYKLNFSFRWLWWDVIFPHKLWKSCLFHLGFWICRPKSKFRDHIWKLGLRKSHFPIKIKEFRGKTQTIFRFPWIVKLTYVGTWWWSKRTYFKKQGLKIIHKYTWYLGLRECIH